MAGEATVARDTLAKGLYERNFDQIVASVNAALAPRTESRGQPRELFIGLLDIFGSEIFPVNRFEQLLVNYANDKCVGRSSVAVSHSAPSHAAQLS
jgi:myosin-5